MPQDIGVFLISLFIDSFYINGTCKQFFLYCVIFELKCFLPFSHLEIAVNSKTPVRINSPNYPKDYPPNSYKFWDIKAPLDYVVALSFESFNIKSSRANLYYGDGVSTFSTDSGGCFSWTKLRDKDIHGNVTSASRNVKLIFTSDDASTLSGFSLLIHATHSKRNYSITISKLFMNYIFFCYHAVCHNSYIDRVSMI